MLYDDVDYIPINVDNEAHRKYMDIMRKRVAVMNKRLMGDPSLFNAENIHTLHGAGFFDDFGKGFMQGFRGVTGIAKQVLPIIAPGVGSLASAGLSAVGLGKKRGRPKKKYSQSEKDKEDERLAEKIALLEGKGGVGGKKRGRPKKKYAQSKKDKEDERLAEKIALLEGKGGVGGKRGRPKKKYAQSKKDKEDERLAEKIALLEGKGGVGGKKKGGLFFGLPSIDSIAKAIKHKKEWEAEQAKKKGGVGIRPSRLHRKRGPESLARLAKINLDAAKIGTNLTAKLAKEIPGIKDIPGVSQVADAIIGVTGGKRKKNMKGKKSKLPAGFEDVIEAIAVDSDSSLSDMEGNGRKRKAGKRKANSSMKKRGAEMKKLMKEGKTFGEASKYLSKHPELWK